MIELINELKNRKKDFTIEYTTNTIKLRFDGKTLLTSGTGISRKHFWLLSHTQKLANDFIEKNPSYAHLNTSRYVDTTGIENIDYMRDCYEIDIKSAYAKTALKMGLWNDDLFNKVNNKRYKKARNAALGNIASNKKIVEFKNGVKFGKTIENRKPTAPIFFTIASSVDMRMALAKAISMEKEAYLMYWVDAIMVKTNKSASEIRDFFGDWGYETKVKKIIEYYNLYDRVVIIDADRKRTFNKSVENIKRKLLL